MSLKAIQPLRYGGVKSTWLDSLPDSGTEMLTISSTGVVSRQAIPSGGSFAGLTGLPSDNAALASALDAKAATIHNHAIADTTGLQTALDSKLNLSGGTLTGPILLPLGSAASPSYSFSGDSDTGIYSSQANTIDMAFGGVTLHQFQSDGSIKLGGTDPWIYHANFTIRSPSLGVINFRSGVNAADATINAGICNATSGVSGGSGGNLSGYAATLNGNQIFRYPGGATNRAFLGKLADWLGTGTSENFCFSSYVNEAHFFVGNQFADGQQALVLSSTTATTNKNLQVNGNVNTTGQMTVGATDLPLIRDAAGILAQRNGATAQAHRVYQSYTNGSNYHRWKVDWSSSTCRFGTERAGTGATGNMELWQNGGAIVGFNSGGKIFFHNRDITFGYWNGGNVSLRQASAFSGILDLVDSLSHSTYLALSLGNLIVGGAPGTTTSRIKNTSGTVNFRLGNDSADANITAANALFSGYVTSGMQTLTANPSTVDITTGLSRMVKNSTSGEVRHWVNDGGTMKSVLLS